jgi:hypothetical protein
VAVSASSELTMLFDIKIEELTGGLNCHFLSNNFLSCNIIRPPLWSSGQSSWLQIRRPGFDSRHYQIFLKKKWKTSSRSGTGTTQPREYN